MRPRACRACEAAVIGPVMRPWARGKGGRRRCARAGSPATAGSEAVHACLLQLLPWQSVQPQGPWHFNWQPRHLTAITSGRPRSGAAAAGGQAQAEPLLRGLSPQWLTVTFRPDAAPGRSAFGHLLRCDGVQTITRRSQGTLFTLVTLPPSCGSSRTASERRHRDPPHSTAPQLPPAAPQRPSQRPRTRRASQRRQQRAGRGLRRKCRRRSDPPPRASTACGRTCAARPEPAALAMRRGRPGPGGASAAGRRAHLGMGAACMPAALLALLLLLAAAAPASAVVSFKATPDPEEGERRAGCQAVHAAQCCRAL